MPSSLKRFKNQNGFTLTELLMVIIILGVLAALAVPNYTLTIEVARSSEAKGDLQQIYSGQTIYKMPTASYWDPAATLSVSNIDATLRTALSTQYYTIQNMGTGVGGSTFTAVAKRANSSTKEFTITNANSIVENGNY